LKRLTITVKLAAPPFEAFEHLQLPHFSNKAIKVVSQLSAFDDNSERAKIFNQKKFSGALYLIEFITTYHRLPEAIT
jgi:hypothetical protein